MGLFDKLKGAADSLLGTRQATPRPAPRVPAPRVPASRAPTSRAPAPADEPTPAASARLLGDPTIAAQIYGRDSCPWCLRARRLAERERIDAVYYDLEALEHADLHETLRATTEQRTVPYIFVRGRFVGGYRELDGLVRSDTLKDVEPDTVRAASAGAVHAGAAPWARFDAG